MNTLNTIENVTLHLANKIYVKKGYSPKATFKDIVTSKFHAEIDAIEFTDSGAADAINKWCKDKTNNKIDKLLEQGDLSQDTRMVLLNAIYFKGNWQRQFDKRNTQKKPFYLNDKDSVDVDMMFISNDFFFSYNQELDSQILQLKYTNDAVSMLIVLPNKRDGIKELEAKLVNYDLNKLTEKMYKQKVDVYLPKFKIETDMDLEQPLRNVRNSFENCIKSLYFPRYIITLLSKIYYHYFFQIYYHYTSQIYYH